MKRKNGTFKVIIAALLLIVCCFVLTSCDLPTEEQRIRSSISAEKNAQVNATPIPQDTTDFYEKTTSSVKGTYHCFNAKNTQKLVNFLEWLDMDRFEIVDILTDGDLAFEFYVLYKNKEIEAR